MEDRVSLNEISSCSTSSDSINRNSQTSSSQDIPRNSARDSNHKIFCWHHPKWDDEEPPVYPESQISQSLLLLEQVDSKHDKIIVHEAALPPDTWLVDGQFGSRNALLVFRSSALADSSELAIQEKPGFKLHVTYKVLQAETKLLSKILDCHGVTEVATNSSDFNLLWTGSHPKPGTLRALGSHQRVNHFPRSYELTRKDRLYKNIERLQHLKGFKHFDFIPQTFVMPTEYKELCTVHHRTKGPWIVKPVASSRGRGIFIVESPNQVPLEEPVVVAKYISKPLLVAGHKCDLRLYVVVTSFHPLLIYIYEEGLVRFATVKYDSSHKQLWNPCMHLCNYSINKYHSDYVKSDDPSAENVGHKWTLSALLRHLKSEGKNTTLLMSHIEDLVIKAILASANSIISACKMFVPHPNNCFELYGFDILIDSNLKPWLLEINLSPSLGCDLPLDVRLKSAMLSDLLTLVGIPAVDPILRPSAASIRPKSRNNSSGKLNLGSCRRVQSADGLSNTLPKNKSSPSNNGRLSTSVSTLSSEEARIVKSAKAQFERRGGFVRIFPSVDSWAKYSQYLDPVTGIPVNGTTSVSSYSLHTNHNYNLLLFTQLYPQVPMSSNRVCEKIHSKYNSCEWRRDSSLERQNAICQVPVARQDRYERMLMEGHKNPLHPQTIIRQTKCDELRKQIMDVLKTGRTLSQFQARRTFSRYLTHVLKRISAAPEQQDHVEVVLKFLQKASNYLRTPFPVKSPSSKLDFKDRAAVIAKQLNDFLYLYNRETDLFVDKAEKSHHVPVDLYNSFLDNARECDLEEILIEQTTHNTVPTQVVRRGFRGVLKCIPNTHKTQSLKPNYKQNPLAKKVTPLS